MSKAQAYDVIVIGGGPGGYVAAIRATQLGLRTACVERRGALGGTCLNIGCIPSKAMLQSSHHFESAAHGFAEHGIQVSGLKLDLKAMMARKDKVVHDLTQGIEFLLKKNRIDYLAGHGRIIEAGKVAVKPMKRGAEETIYEARDIIIATGSSVTPLKGVKIDEKRIVSSTGAISLEDVPKKMVVIGAGVIGLELGSVWRRLGAEVVVIEFLDHILPGMDAEVSKQMRRILTRQGLAFRLSTRVVAAKAGSRDVALTIQSATGGKTETLKADTVLVSIGRKPNTEGLGLDAVGVETDERGFIRIDGKFQTTVPGIFAIGDVTGGMMLAHKAEEEGVACAELLAGEAGHINYGSIPSIVYTWPEVASVGKTEEQLKADGADYHVGKFPFTANSRARANADADGFVKILADAESDAILGAHIIGPAGGDLIQEIVVGMELGASAEDIARICHGHPGLPEAVKEAALNVGKRAIHV